VSDEQRKDEETEVEGHIERLNHAEPVVDAEDDEDDVQAHARLSSIRMD
jgi:hypothetical protein